MYPCVAKFVSIGLFYRPLLAKNPNFYRFFWTRHFVVSPIGSSLRKLDTGAQLQTSPYPTASKLFLYSSAFMAKLGAQSLTFKVTDQQTDRQTDKQTKKTPRFWPPQQRVKSEPTKLGMVTEDLEHVQARARSCTSKTWASDA